MKNTKVYDSRSYNTFITKSDHKPVIAKINIQWKTNKKTKNKKSLNLQKLQDQQISNQFASQVTNILSQQQAPTTNQKSWDHIVKAINEAAENTIGFKERTKKCINEKIAVLSQQQKQINIYIQSTKNEQLKKQLKIQRNRLLTEIHTETRK